MKSLTNFITEETKLPERKVFLGGTCADTTWREELIEDLMVEYFNPVVDDWTEDCIKIENDEKENKCNIHLYVITKEMEGAYSIAEAVESVHNKDKKTIFWVISNGFEKHQLKSFQAICELIKKHGGKAVLQNNMNGLAKVINNVEV